MSDGPLEGLQGRLRSAARSNPVPERKAPPAAAGTPKLDLAKCIEDELHSTMQFTDEQGNPLELPKMKVLAKQLVNISIKKGDVRRLEGLLPKAEVERQEQFTETDLAMIARFMKKMLSEGDGS